MRIVNCQKDPHDIYIGRSSIWSNPWSHRPGKNIILVESLEEAIDNFTYWLKGDKFTDISQDRRRVILSNLSELKDKILGCWCYSNDCHGRILHMFANGIIKPN